MDRFDCENIPDINNEEADDVTFLLQNWENTEEDLECEVIDLCDKETSHHKKKASKRNDIPLPSLILDGVVWFEHVLTPGMTVEVSGFDSQRYIRISQIIQNDDAIILRGVQYVHMVDMQGMLPWSVEQHRNEVCAIYHVDVDDPRPNEVQAAVEIDLESVKGVIVLKLSNALWPVPATANDELVCRWKFIQYFPSARVRERHLESYSLYQGLEGALIRNNEHDADLNCAVCPETLRQSWFKTLKTRGGSYVPPSEGTDSQDFAHHEHGDENDTRNRAVGQKYTFFDAFCGAGGASRGAMRAGLHLKYAIDAWDLACESYQRNFGGVKLFCMKVDEWVRLYASPDNEKSDNGTQFQCDVLHLSPPCQVFSPAHTINSHEKDEANFAALFACEAIINCVRPRIFTFEQTFGLLHRNWRPVFNSLITSFTRCGYAVRWKYVFLHQWGLPARRKRLIMIGAAPGESLPSFPPPTHSDRPWQSGLPPLVTVRQALGKLNVQRDDPLHRPREMKQKNMPRWDTNNILSRCVTTSGGQNYHFSGRRCFTHREFAILQGFPTYHEFVGAFRIRQIGNAFPPCAASVLFKHIEKCLLEADGVLADKRDQVLADAMAIELDDEDEDDENDHGTKEVRDHGFENDTSDDDDELLRELFLRNQDSKYRDDIDLSTSMAMNSHIELFLETEPDDDQSSSPCQSENHEDTDDWKEMFRPTAESSVNQQHRYHFEGYTRSYMR
ncbi:uncharacterized protein BROUX77_003889 [Berkeleyomyces rouxiae]|uniref:uncharacterized protein n=1 Tax=Berkeleyomyces rouxiae TaxID=2035830 RepID=UPI003B7B80F0